MGERFDEILERTKAAFMEMPELPDKVGDIYYVSNPTDAAEQIIDSLTITDKLLLLG